MNRYTYQHLRLQTRKITFTKFFAAKEQYLVEDNMPSKMEFRLFRRNEFRIIYLSSTKLKSDTTIFAIKQNIQVEKKLLNVILDIHFVLLKLLRSFLPRFRVGCIVKTFCKYLNISLTFPSISTKTASAHRLLLENLSLHKLLG